MYCPGQAIGTHHDMPELLPFVDTRKRMLKSDTLSYSSLSSTVEVLGCWKIVS